MVSTQSAEVRIYVASLSDYNAGTLHGEWIDAAQDVEDLAAAVAAMLAASPTPGAEEFAIHDHEGFGGLPIGEYEPLANVSAIALAIEEHGAALPAYLAHRGETDDDAIASFEDAFLGSWDSAEHYAESFLDDLGVMDEVPEMLKSYIDVAGFARDLELGGDIYTVEDPDEAGVFIFDGHV